MPQIYFTADAPDWDPLERYFAAHKGEVTYFRGALVKEAEMERRPKLVISEFSFRTAGNNISSDEIFGLMMDINHNVSTEFTTAAITNLEMHNIMRVRTSSSRCSSEIKHEMIQARWGIHTALAKNTVNCMTQQGARISFQHLSLTNRIRTNDRILW